MDALSFVNTEPARALRMAGAIGNWSRVYGILRNVWDSPSMKRQVYGPAMLDCELPDMFDWIEGGWPCDEEPVRAMQDFEWKNKMVNDLLWQEDRCSMAFGLEVRVPFLDQDLYAFARNIPVERLMPKGKKKYQLKKMAENYLAPEVLARPKSGFQVDSPGFFNSYLRPLADQYLNERAVIETGLFNPQFVKQLLSLPVKKAWRWHYFMLYLMLLIQIWHKLYIDGEGYGSRS
jgi:asparagine synthase (glutamine-hydrolysing)